MKGVEIKRRIPWEDAQKMGGKRFKKGSHAVLLEKGGESILGADKMGSLSNRSARGHKAYPITKGLGAKGVGL